VDLRKGITNLKGNVIMLQKELERVTYFEHSFTQASAKVETREAELKRVVLELQYRIKEEVQELRQHAENLETD